MQRLIICCLVLASFVLYAELAEGLPGRSSSGGGRSSSSSSRSSSIGSRIKSVFTGNKNKGPGGSSSSGGYSAGGFSSAGLGGKTKKHSKLGGRLKKAAVIGAVAYGGYQLGKLSGSFGSWGAGYQFNDWNKWREADGFMCRSTNDCSWIDPRLYCQDYELDFSPMRGWFGGDYLSIVGECSCPDNLIWSDNDMKCREVSAFGAIAIGAGAIIGIIMAAIVGCCCCVGACFFAKKAFSS